MGQRFYLASADLGDYKPRKCEVVREVKGVLRPRPHYLLVDVTPPIRAQYRDGPETEYKQVIIALVGDRKLGDIGKVSVFGEVVLCPAYVSGAVDEKQCSKIATELLHATYADAEAANPWGDR